jgi:hypothetical protein
VTNNSPEQRRRGRVSVRLEVTVCLEDKQIEVESRNLSLTGLACSPHPLLQKNLCCRVVISLAPKVQAVIKGRVVRVDGLEAAIDFLSMDPESFIHLKKIVEYHSRRPERVAGEILTPAFSIFRSRTPFVSRRGRKP